MAKKYRFRMDEQARLKHDWGHNFPKGKVVTVTGAQAIYTEWDQGCAACEAETCQQHLKYEYSCNGCWWFDEDILEPIENPT